MVKKAFKITTANKTLWFKVLVGRVVYYICFFLLVSLLFGKQFKGYFASSAEAVGKILESVLFYIRDLFKMEHILNSVTLDTDYSAIINESITKLFNIFTDKMAWAVVGIFVLYQTKNFIFGILDYTTGVMANEHMTRLQHSMFTSTLVDNIKKSVLYGLYRFVMLFVYNLLLFIIVQIMFFLILDVIGIIAVPISLVLILVGLSLRQTYAGQVMALSLCENMGCFRAFKECFKRSKGKRCFEKFITFFAVNTAVFAVSVCAFIVTFGVSILITGPFVVVFYSVIKFVNYYEDNPRKYYLSFDEIVVPKELRENDESLLNKVDI